MECQIYFPPQFTAAVLTLGGGALSSIAAGIVAAIDGRLTRHLYWSNSFQVAVVAGLLGPIAVGLQVHYPPLISLSPTLEVVVAILAGVAYLALPSMALIYLRGRRPAAPSPPLGGPGVRTSLSS